MIHMRKIRFLLFAILLLTVFTLTACSEKVTYSETVFMGVDVISREELSELTVGKQLIFDSKGSELTFNGNPVPYYGNRLSYLLPVDISTEEWEEGRLSVSEGKLYFLESEILSAEAKLSSVAENTSCTLVHVTGSEYCEYSLTFTGLPIMSVNTKATPADRNVPIGEEDVACVISMYEPKSERGDVVYQVSDAYFHQRGGSTLSSGYLKTGYRINLRYTNEEGEEKNNHLSFCGLRTEDDWILLPLYTEDTKVREKFCIDTWEMFGLEENDYDMDNGTRMEYVEVILNGEYWGMFGLVEPIDGKQLNLTDGDVLVKIHSWTKPKASILRTLGNTVLYVDYSAALAEQETMDIKYPKDVTQESWDVMATFMEYVYESVPQRLARDLHDWIDVENAVDHWLFTNFICAEDNVWKNLYISFKKDEDFYKIYLTPWDFDLTFGESWDGNAYLHWRYNPGIVDNIDEFEYTRAVIDHVEGGKEACYTRWHELRADILDYDNIIQRIDDIQSFVFSTGAYARDEEKWPEGGHTTDLEYLKDIIKARLEFLDSYINGTFGPDKW